LEHNPKRNHITYQEEVRERNVQKEKETERVVKLKIECVKEGEGRRGEDIEREKERKVWRKKEIYIWVFFAA
jgi:hypothetical protein